jgi:3-phosphoshikimate 1-carboxyvinyltransferase
MGSQPPIEVVPLGGAIEATWTVPGSKSMTNRGLVLAALSEGTTELRGVLHSDDTRHMANALRGMGIDVENVGETTMVVRGGKSKLRVPDKPLFIGNSGTTVRFLTAMATLVPGPVTFEGDEHMAKRPISDLVDALRQLDIKVECPTGCPPLTVHGTGLPGGSIKMPGTKSSQYFSAVRRTSQHAAAARVCPPTDPLGAALILSRRCVFAAAAQRGPRERSAGDRSDR